MTQVGAVGLEPLDSLVLFKYIFHDGFIREVHLAQTECYSSVGVLRLKQVSVNLYYIMVTSLISLKKTFQSLSLTLFNKVYPMVSS